MLNYASVLLNMLFGGRFKRQQSEQKAKKKFDWCVQVNIIRFICCAHNACKEKKKKKLFMQ